MTTWYAGAAAMSIVLLVSAFLTGATIAAVLVGAATGLVAGTALVFVTQKTIEDIERAKRAPATIVVLSMCIRVYQEFKYTWIEMANSIGAMQNDTDWTSKELFAALQEKIDLQETVATFFGLRPATVTWEKYLDIRRDLCRRRIQELLTAYVTYLDPEIMSLLYVIYVDSDFCGSYFQATYKGKHHSGNPEWNRDDLYNRLKRDIYIFTKLGDKVEEKLENLQYSRKDALIGRLMYGATKPSGEW